MAGIRSANTRPEITIRKALHALGFRYRLHARNVPGKPDIVFPRYRAALFVNGCFWHGHDCARGARVPKTNRDYWLTKVARNRARDAASQAALIGSGWRCQVVWECELKDAVGLKSRLARWMGGAE